MHGELGSSKGAKEHPPAQPHRAIQGSILCIQQQQFTVALSTAAGTLGRCKGTGVQGSEPCRCLRPRVLV